MLIDIHTHPRPERHGTGMAVQMIREAHKKGLDGIVFTDHSHKSGVWTPEDCEAVRQEAGVDIVVLSGQEVTIRGVGDVLVFGPQETIARNTSLSEIRDRYSAAALVWAHPYRKRRDPEIRLFPLFDAIEVFNGNTDDDDIDRAVVDWHFYRHVAVAGSDAHRRRRVGKNATLFDHRVGNVEILAKETRAGRCRPSC